MKKRDRVRRRRDFQRALSGARVYAGATLVAVALATGQERSRVGITASRGIRGSVRRNRARRRLRELARRHLLADDSPLRAQGISYDVVLIARQAAVDAAFDRLVADGQGLLRRLRAESAPEAGRR